MKQRKAFTFWEVLIVVAVFAIVAAILFPTDVFHGPNQNARRSSCQSNLKQIGLAFAQYARDADSEAPPVANARGGWAQLITPYLKSEAIFQCPSASGNKTGATDYFFNARLAGTKDKLGNDAKSVFTILCGEGDADQNASYNLSQWPAQWRKDESSPAYRHLDGANYLFVDGHVKWFKPQKIFGAPDAGAKAATPTFEVK